MPKKICLTTGRFRQAFTMLVIRVRVIALDMKLGPRGRKKTRLKILKTVEAILIRSLKVAVRL